MHLPLKKKKCTPIMHLSQVKKSEKKVDAAVHRK